MRVKLVRIGNSRGIRIPKVILEQCGLQETPICRSKDRRVIARERRPRQDWEKAFAPAGPSSNDETLLEAPPGNKFDREDWRW